MKLYVFVDPAAALRRGETCAGNQFVVVDAPLLQALTPDQREAMIPFISDSLGPGPDRALHATGCDPASIRAALENVMAAELAKAAAAREAELERERILRDPHDALELDQDGEPGRRWSAPFRTDPRLQDATIAGALRLAAFERNRAEWLARGAELLSGGVEALVAESPGGCPVFAPAMTVHYNAAPMGVDEKQSAAFAAADAERGRRRQAARMAKEAAEARLEAEHRESERRLLAEHGTQSQRERWEAGVLPGNELREVAHGVLFVPLEGFERSKKVLVRCPDECVQQNIYSESEDWSGPYTHDEWETVRALKAAAARVPGASFGVCRKIRRCRECGEKRSMLAGRVAAQWAGRELVREYRVPARKEEKCQDREPKSPSPRGD